MAGYAVQFFIFPNNLESYLGLDTSFAKLLCHIEGKRTPALCKAFGIPNLLAEESNTASDIKELILCVHVDNLFGLPGRSVS